MNVQANAQQPRDIKALLAADDLSGALTLASEAVKRAPQDVNSRLLLIDLLILTDDYERADKQAAMAATLAPKQAIGLSLLRGEIRGMEARRRWYADAAVPAFPHGPTSADEAAIRLAIALKASDGGAIAEAAARLADVPSVDLSRDGASSRPVRDLDDLLPHALEIVTSGGAYLWIDFAAIARIAFAPRSRPRDLAWRRAELRLRNGSEATVLVPALYRSPAPVSDALRLGRETQWLDRPGGIVTGLGQRCLLIGEEMVALSEIESLTAEGGDG